MANLELNNSALVEKYDWKESEGNIPTGWKYRIFFITPGGTALVGKVQAMDSMQKNNSSE